MLVTRAFFTLRSMGTESWVRIASGDVPDVLHEVSCENKDKAVSPMSLSSGFLETTACVIKYYHVTVLARIDSYLRRLLRCVALVVIRNSHTLPS